MGRLNPQKLDAIANWMRDNADKGRIAGSSILLLQDGAPRLFHAAGQRSISRQLPYETGTLTRIYSMTKPVTTVVALQLVSEGRMDLRQPVSDVLPEFSDCRALRPDATSVEQTEPAPCPTLFQLLVHTSGMTYNFNPGLLAAHYLDQGISFEPENGALRAMVRRVAGMPLAFQPGTRWEYSVGLDVMGAVIEEVTGQSLDRVFRERVFDPLGMDDTFFIVPEDRLADMADCYTCTAEDPLKLFDAGQTSVFGPNPERTFSGGGGLVSTLEDYGRFAEALRRNGQFDGGTLLSETVVAGMKRNRLGVEISEMGPTSFAEMPMTGLGFGLGGAVVVSPDRLDWASSAGDFGWGGIAGTYFWIDPVHQITCVFFTQIIPSGCHPLRPELKALVHAALE